MRFERGLVVWWGRRGNVFFFLKKKKGKGKRKGVFKNGVWYPKKEGVLKVLIEKTS